MKQHPALGIALAAAAAGAVTGLFGAGGGMVLVPLLTCLTDVEEDSIFPSSVSIILPICLVTVMVSAFRGGLPLKAALPYLVGSGLGGFLSGRFGRKIPTKYLHRILGIFIVWGGIRYLC